MPHLRVPNAHHFLRLCVCVCVYACPRALHRLLTLLLIVPLQSALFLIHGAIALCFLAGYRTRVAAVLLWACTTSLQNRNLLLLDFGDDLLRVTLFWCMFLPMGARYSVDDFWIRATGSCPSSQRVAPVSSASSSASKVHSSPLSVRRTEPEAECSVASTALLFQIALMYWTAAALKTEPEWTDGSASTFSCVCLPCERERDCE
jgi:hypothetical protein